MLSVTDPGRRSLIANPERKPYARIPEVLPIPNLIELQLNSFNWFIDHGLRELLDEISPIQDFTGRVMELRFREYEFETPKYTELECRTRDLTFSKPLYVWVELLIKETGEIQRQRVYMGDYPWMTDQGTFIINGAERVVVSQLVRSPGVYFERDPDPATGKLLTTAKLIPNRGAWLEFETSNRDILSVKVDRKRKMPVSILLRAVGLESDEDLRAAFADVDTNEDRRYIATTMDKEPTKSREEALIELYRRLRPGDPPTRAPLTLTDVRRLPARFWLVVLLGAVFTLARFSEAFLVLRAQNVGLGLDYVPMIMIVMNVMYAAAAYPAGAAADRLRQRTLLLIGLALLILADLALALATSPLLAFVGSALWGLHMAFTQGLLSKLVAETAPAALRGSAFGLFNLVSGGALLLASVIAGALWSMLGPAATFLAGAAFAGVAAAGLVARASRSGKR